MAPKFITTNKSKIIKALDEYEDHIMDLSWAAGRGDSYQRKLTSFLDKLDMLTERYINGKISGEQFLEGLVRLNEDFPIIEWLSNGPDAILCNE